MFLDVQRSKLRINFFLRVISDYNNLAVNQFPCVIVHIILARWFKWRACDVGEAKQGLENELDVGEAMEGLENELWCSFAHSPTFSLFHLLHNSFSNPSLALPTSQLILQPFRCFTYATVHSQLFFRFPYVTSRAHSPTFPSLHLSHSTVSNPSVASPTSQFIVQPFFRFSYVTSCSLNSAGEPPIVN